MSDVMDYEIVDEEPPDEAPEDRAPNPDAPYGYKKDGTPYKRRPNRAGSRKGGRKRSTTQYGKVVEDLIMSFAQPLGLAGLATRNDVLIAHSWVLADRAGPVGEAMQGVAEQNDRIAAAIEKLAEVSPYAELTAAIMPAIPQILCNVGMLKPGVLGTIDPHQIAASYYQANGQEPPVMDVESEEVPVNGNGYGSHVSD
jgi:hypothetical protein